MLRAGLITMALAASVLALGEVAAADAAQLAQAANAHTGRSATTAFSTLSPVATFPTPAGGSTFGSVSGSATSLATSYDGPALSALNVFGRPSSGWSSSVTPAVIAAPTGARIEALLSAGSWVIGENVSAPAFHGIQADVFSEPADGWSGTVPLSATLMSSTPARQYGAGAAPIAVTGGAAFIAHGLSVDVFPRPSAGWSGDERPTATLRIPAGFPKIVSLEGSGRTLVVDRGASLYVFQEPTRGWHGSIFPIARLIIPGRVTYNSRSVAVDADAIAVTGSKQGLPAVFTYAKPARGWMAAPAATTRRIRGGNLTLALTGETVGLLQSVNEEHTCPCMDTLSAFSLPVGPFSRPLILPTRRVESYSGNEALTATGSDFASVSTTGVTIYSRTTARP